MIFGCSLGLLTMGFDSTVGVVVGDDFDLDCEEESSKSNFDTY